MREAVDLFCVLCPDPVALCLETHNAGRTIAHKYGYNFYDALVVAAALEASCTTLYPEDLQDGQVINQQLTIRNPFK